MWGVLYAPMLLQDGAAVEAAFGARPLFEADLLVRVSAAPRINQAKTPQQVLQHIDQVIPAIELPDLVVEAPPKLNGAGVAAINVGARYFVTGAPIAVKRTHEFADSLASMKVLVMGGGEDLDTRLRPRRARPSAQRGGLAGAGPAEAGPVAEEGRPGQRRLVLQADAAQGRG